MTVKSWEVWLAYYPFSDTADVKKRPVLIFPLADGGSAFMKMTSKPPRRSGDYALSAWRNAGLFSSTTVQTAQSLRYDPALLIKKIGMLHPADIVGVSKLL